MWIWCSIVCFNFEVILSIYQQLINFNFLFLQVGMRSFIFVFSFSSPSSFLTFDKLNRNFIKVYKIILGFYLWYACSPNLWNPIYHQQSVTLKKSHAMVSVLELCCTFLSRFLKKVISLWRVFFTVFSRWMLLANCAVCRSG